MKPTLILMLLGLALPASARPCAAGRGSHPAPDPAEKSAGEDELDLAVQLTSQAYRRQLDIMRTMQDAVSAANAMPALRQAMCMRYKLYGMGVDYAEYCMRCDAVVREDAMACSRELKRLEDAAFYGLTPLKALFVRSDPTVRACVGESLPAAEPLPPEDAEEVAERFRVDMARYQQGNAWLVGGSGFSRDSAWVVTVEDDVVARERDFMRSVLRVSPCGKSLHEVDGRVYDCLYAVVTLNGEPYRMEQWFDVTLCLKVGAPQAADDIVAEDMDAADDEPALATLPAPIPDMAQIPGRLPAAGDDAADAAADEDELVAEDPDLD